MGPVTPLPAHREPAPRATARRVSAALHLVLPLVLATALALAMLAGPRAATTEDAPSLELRSRSSRRPS